MERYFIDYKLHNKVNDGWAYATTKSTTNYDEALKEFYSQCTRYIGGDTFDHALIILNDMFGNIIKKELWSAPTPIPEPIIEEIEDEETEE